MDIRLKRLQKSCEITLNRYMTVANDTCSLTGKLRVMPVSKDKRLEVFLQAKKEDQALEAHLKSREALLSAIKSDPETVTAMTLEVPQPPATHGKPRPGAYRRRTG